MREFIKQQLKQVAFADLSHYDEATCTFNIPKYSEPKYEVGKTYIIEVSGILVNNNTSVIAANWNNCTSPTNKYLKAYVSNTMGKMIYVDSLVYNMETQTDTTIFWSGWLPVEQLKQLGVCDE